jgi:hypothetical protein
MTDTLGVLRRQLLRQVSHWELAAAALANLEHSASPHAWASLERYMGIALRRHLDEAASQLQREAVVVRAMFHAARSTADLGRVAQQLAAFRDRYLRTETLTDFYGQAVNTRTNPELATNLRAFDVLATRSMAPILEPQGKSVPPVLTYLDKGLGASILKAGLRLWDGSVSPVAAVKVTYHNRRRPTALIHETGHQVAHIVDWNSELSSVLSEGLRREPSGLGSTWASWASEVAADCFGFVHTGFASVAALTDVVSGDAVSVFRHIPGDPHPICYIRVWLGIEMCRRFFGRGPWDELATAWDDRYPLEQAHTAVRDVLQRSRALLPQIVELCLLRRMRAFGGRALADLIDPAQVSPPRLERLEADLGGALYTSRRWIWLECRRLIALTGYRIATNPESTKEIVKLQDQFMDRLGSSVATIYVAATA